MIGALVKRWFGGAYTAASTPPGRAPWIPPRGTATEAIAPALDTVAARARDAVRNNPYAARIVDTWTANLVGTGIASLWPEPHASAWRKWTESRSCDAQGHNNWGGLQVLVARCLVESGEALVRFRRVSASTENPVGLQLLVMEADALAADYTDQAGGRRIVQGIEMDRVGRPVAYWLRKGDGLERERVAASDMLHVFRRRRPDQYRDISWLAPVLWTLKDLSSYEAALIQKARVEASLAAIVIDEDVDTLTGRTDAVEPVRDMHGRPVEDIQPGTILYRRGGSVQTISPTGGGGHLGFAKRTLESVAVGVGLTYDQLSGDLSEANYSSLRAGKIEHRRLLEQLQYTVLIPMLIGPVAERFHAGGVLAGLWGAQMPAVTHTPPPPEMIDPGKDTAALVAQVRAGLVSPQEAAAYLGYDFAEVARQTAAAQAMWDELGVVTDADPRRTAKSGGAHDPAQVAAVEIAATGAASEQ